MSLERNGPNFKHNLFKTAIKILDNLIRYKINKKNLLMIIIQKKGKL